jgi:hypothetical protein
MSSIDILETATTLSWPVRAGRTPQSGWSRASVAGSSRPCRGTPEYRRKPGAERRRPTRPSRDPPPLSFFIQAFVGWHLVYVRRCDDAIALLRKTLEIETDFAAAHLGLWGAFYRKGVRAEALAAATSFFTVLGDDGVVEAPRRRESVAQYEGAMRLAALELETRAATTHVPAVRIARLWAQAGDADRAVEWLEKAYAWRESPLVHLRVGWDWDGLRGDPRFQSLLHRMRFPEGISPPASGS